MSAFRSKISTFAACTENSTEQSWQDQGHQQLDRVMDYADHLFLPDDLWNLWEKFFLRTEIFLINVDQYWLFEIKIFRVHLFVSRILFSYYSFKTAFYIYSGGEIFYEAAFSKMLKLAGSDVRKMSEKKSKADYQGALLITEGKYGVVDKQQGEKKIKGEKRNGWNHGTVENQRMFQEWGIT